MEEDVIMKAISDDLKTQWEDHFHMRDQMWKVLNCSIAFLVGVFALEAKNAEATYLILFYFGVLATTLSGVIIGFHHRLRQEEKFAIIVKYEKELRVYDLISEILDSSKKTWIGRRKASTYIIVMLIAICLISASRIVALLIKAKPLFG